MDIICERCAEPVFVRDDLVAAAATEVECSFCRHVFIATPAMAAAPQALLNCVHCSFEFRVARALIPENERVSCPHCRNEFVLPARQHRLRRDPPPARAQQNARMFFGAPPQSAPAPRRDLNALPDPSEPPAESYRSAQGRMVFGSFEPPSPGRSEMFPTCPHCAARLPPGIENATQVQCTSCQRVVPRPANRNNVMVFGAPPLQGNASVEPRPQPFRVERAPVPPATPNDPVESMKASVADDLDNQQQLLVLADALMERDDPQGRLISFMLAEEQQTDLMRKVKVNVLIRDHSSRWAPPGARITGFRRGIPTELEWSGDTDPMHLAWRSARSIHVTLERVPPESVFDVLRPNLRRVTGLNRAFFAHVARAAPAGLELLNGQIHVDELLGEAQQALARMPKLQFVTLRTTTAPFDARLTVRHLDAFLEGAGRLKGVRLSLPQLPLRTLDLRCGSSRLKLQFVVPWHRALGAPHTLVVDVRKRQLVTPPGVTSWDLVGLLGELTGFLGEPLSVVQAEADR